MRNARRLLEYAVLITEANLRRLAIRNFDHIGAVGRHPSLSIAVPLDNVSYDPTFNDGVHNKFSLKRIRRRSGLRVCQRRLLLRFRWRLYMRRMRQHHSQFLRHPKSSRHCQCPVRRHLMPSFHQLPTQQRPQK